MATFFGGSGQEFFAQIEIGLDYNLCGGFNTQSVDVPMVNATQDQTGGVRDMLFFQLNEQGYLNWSTYYGGSDSELVYSLSIDAFGDVVFVGQTISNDFPQDSVVVVGTPTYSTIVKLAQNGQPEYSRIYGTFVSYIFTQQPIYTAMYTLPVKPSIPT